MQHEKHGLCDETWGQFKQVPFKFLLGKYYFKKLGK